MGGRLSYLSYDWGLGLPPCWLCRYMASKKLNWGSKPPTLWITLDSPMHILPQAYLGKLLSVKTYLFPLAEHTQAL